MEPSITTVDPSGRGVATLNLGDRITVHLGWGNTVLNEGLVELLGRGNM